MTLLHVLFKQYKYHLKSDYVSSSLVYINWEAFDRDGNRHFDSTKPGVEIIYLSVSKEDTCIAS